MRALGLDIGSVTVGVALSDSLKMFASSLTVIRYEQEDENLFKIFESLGLMCYLLGFKKKTCFYCETTMMNP